MTYYYHSTVSQYEFTALTLDDLQDAGVYGGVSCGDTFEMPAYASTCLTVTDNDGTLSGDSYCNENASDHSYQTAQIMTDGAAVGNGGQIYAEKYFWVSDAHGNWYVMIEIEQEGSSGKYYSFYEGSGYSAPAAGTELTVGSACNVTSDWISYNHLDAGDKGPATGTVSGTVFCDTNCDGINGIVEVVPGCDYTIEAEHMWKYGFSTVSGEHASGGKLVKLNCFGGYGELCTDFTGKDGTYDVKIRVQDENDGQSLIRLLVNGHYVDAVRLDGDGDGSGDNDGGFSTYVLKDVDLKAGDDLSLAVCGDNGELVRLDKIVLEGKDQTTLTEEPVKAGVTVKLLDSTGAVYATTTTDASGNYTFEDVPVGDYKIMGVAPDGTEFTIKDAGSDDTIDSDVGSDGTSDTFTVTADSNTDIDLGVCDKPLGALSGRYFCDDNRDGLDNDGPNNGLAGITVELLDAAGNGTGITTVTDADGNYRFDDLEAGTYGVKFTDTVSGKQLTIQDVDGDVSDDIDSDAQDIGDGMSVIQGIEVVAGEETPDNDAGVFDPNTPPELHDDAGKGCADELIAIDVLANDSDAEDGKPTITAVNGVAIADGDTITIDAVEVTLNGGVLTFDGEVAYAGLDIGEEAMKSFEYTATDSAGASSTANVDVTFCGDANSVASFCDSLPGQVQYQIRTSSIEAPFEDEAFDIKLTSDDMRFDGVVFEDAYCLSVFDPADGDESFDTATLLTADVFCFEEAPADVFNGNQVSIANGKTAAENLDVVNWVLNQDFKDQGFSDWEIQRTIWELTDNIDTDYLDAVDPAFGDAADVDTLVGLALDFDANKTEEYMPGLGDKMGVILDPNPTSAENSQPFILAMEIEANDCLC